MFSYNPHRLFHNSCRVRKVVSLIGSFRLRDRPFTCCAATLLIGHRLIIANTCMMNIRSNIKYSVIPFIDRAYSEASHNDRRAIATVSSGNQTKQFPMKFNSFDTAAVTLMLHSPRLPSPIAISIFDSIIAPVSPESGHTGNFFS